MKFNIIFKTSRKITIELLEYGVYFATEPYQVYINGEIAGTSEKVVYTIDNLKPDTEYEIYLKNDSVQSETVKFRTDYEFVTLNVREFGAKGDGKQDDTLFIQTAIYSCPKDGRVYIPKGIYNITCLFLNLGKVFFSCCCCCFFYLFRPV